MLALLLAAASPTSMDVVNKAVAASQTLVSTAFDGLYASNAVFVDEGPYIGYVVTPAPPIEAQERGGSAYVVIPMNLDGTLGNGSHYHEDGAFTFTLARQSGEWKITSQVWSVLEKKITPP